MMRGSFGGNQGMGGGSGGGGWMLRRVASAVSRTGGVDGRRRGSRAAVHKEQPATPSSPRKLDSPKIISLSPPTTSSSSTSSNPFSNTNNLPLVAPSSGFPASFSSPTSSVCDEFEWVNEDERFLEHGALLDNFVFGSVPSQDEVQNAVTALQQVFDPGSFPHLVRDKYGTISDRNAVNYTSNSTGLIEGVHSFGAELDWIEPSVNLYNSRMMQPRGPRTLYDAFNLLQSESSIQRMVVSLSSDKAVWNAVLNNEVVQELRESLSVESERNSLETEGETPGSTAATSVLMWILDSTTAKAKELMEMIVDIANHLFQPNKPEKTAPGEMNSFEEKLRSSLLLTVVVLLVVVVARVQRT